VNALDQFAARELWVNWKTVTRKGKATKVPFSPVDQRAAEANNASTWGTRAQALRNTGYDGIGLVLGPLDAERHLGGIDLDACIDDKGNIALWARDIVQLLNSYCEVSPSGRGLKVFFLHDPRETLGQGMHWRSSVRRPRAHGKDYGIEFYLRARYFTVTEQLFETYDTIRQVDIETLRLVQARMVAFAPAKRQHHHHSYDDEQRRILEAIARMANADLHWEEWNTRGMAIYAATAGSAAGYAAFLNWSAKSDKFNPGACEERWQHWDQSPPDRLTAGTIFYHAGIEGGYPRHMRQTNGHDPPSPPSSGVVGTKTASATDDPSQEHRGDLPLNVRYEDFVAYSPMGNFIFKPTGQLWTAGVINRRLPWISNGPDLPATAPATWLTQAQPVEQMTWAPGEPQIIRHRLIVEGGWIKHCRASVFNHFKPATIELGDREQAQKWVELGRTLWPNEIDHLIAHFAFKWQHPESKINHAAVLGGPPGIGKDTFLEAVIQAVGPWNVVDISPAAFLGRFNGFARSVILRISEARSSERFDRYAFYEHMKTYAAAPPEVIRVDEKNTREYYVLNRCGPVITLNKLSSLYLPADDRRHHVAWSETTPEHFGKTDVERQSHWNAFWAWYRSGGFNHVAAYLATYDLSTFNPKAPPPKTAGFWRIVDASRAPEDAELADVLDRLKNPMITTLEEVTHNTTDTDFSDWLRERKNRPRIPHRFEDADYAPVRNDAAKDGLWKVDGRRQVIYGRRGADQRALLREAEKLSSKGLEKYAQSRLPGT
jgi:hypothetical protein